MIVRPKYLKNKIKILHTNSKLIQSITNTLNVYFMELVVENLIDPNPSSSKTI